MLALIPPLLVPPAPPRERPLTKPAVPPAEVELLVTAAKQRLRLTRAVQPGKGHVGALDARGLRCEGLETWTAGGRGGAGADTYICSLHWDTLQTS